MFTVTRHSAIYKLYQSYHSRLYLSGSKQPESDKYPESTGAFNDTFAFLKATLFNIFITGLEPYEKIINKIRKTRKDILLVGFKTTCGKSKEIQFERGLKLVKQASANIVFVNDVSPDTYSNGLITPEESSYWYNTREEALEALVDMALKRSNLAFTRSTVVSDALVPWNSSEVSSTLRDVVNYVCSKGAYKTFTLGDGTSKIGSVGHFAQRISSNTFLTSIRKSNFNELDSLGLVKVVTDGPDHIYAYGAKPSVGGQTQRSVFDAHPTLDCIVHFHCPLKSASKDFINCKSQFEAECGSHNAIDKTISLSCAENTVQGLRQYSLDNGQLVWTVHLEHHGPNIVFSADVDAQAIIRFIDMHWELSLKTTGLSEDLI